MILTSTTLSRAAKANISAHETTPLHWVSSLAFALSITSNPRRLGLFAGESFSAVFEEVESMRIEASQPCKHKTLTLFTIHQRMKGLIEHITYS